MGVRAQTADFHLRALARKGYLELDRGARAIRAAGAAAVQQVPVLGAVQAGHPIPAIAEAEGLAPVPPGIRADFALRVTGQSMTGRGIHAGDLVLVRQTEEARSGQVVVALLGHGEATETTVKTWWQQPGQAPELRAAHPDFPPRRLQPDDAVRIAGVVVGLFRGAEAFDA